MDYRYEISWLLEGRIIGAVMEGDLAASPIEFMQSFDAEINRYLDMGTAPLVHALGDMRRVSSMPDFRVMTKVFTFPKHPHFGWQIMVGMEMNPAIKVISYITSQVFKTRSRQFDTFDQALAHLQKVDASLPDLTGLVDHWINAER